MQQAYKGNIDLIVCYNVLTDDALTDTLRTLSQFATINQCQVVVSTYEGDCTSTGRHTLISSADTMNGQSYQHNAPLKAYLPALQARFEQVTMGAGLAVCTPDGLLPDDTSRMERAGPLRGRNTPLSPSKV